MSTKTHVFFRGKLPTKAALSRAMKELGFPFSIKPQAGSLQQQSGFMPMLRGRQETGVEFYFSSDPHAIADVSAEGVDKSFEHSASFRWSGDFEEAAAGMCTAAALAKLTNGVVFDEAEGKLLSVEGAIALARKNLHLLPKPARQRTPRGPTALKRMLAPLLAKRNDLMLAYPLLVIRPVRHLIRGAEFQWHDGGTVCSVGPFIRPLYQPSALFLGFPILRAAVADPDFEPMLFDRLAREIFEPLGKVGSIEDFVASRWTKHMWASEIFPSILLSRGIKQAKAYIEPIEKADEEYLRKAKERLAVADRKDRELMYHRREELKRAEESMAAAKARRAFLARGASAIFAHYREWEAKVARGHKVEQSWEPAPFPAELPVTQRPAKSADPILTPTPWLDFPGYVASSPAGNAR